jgi:hypothetical protein
MLISYNMRNIFSFIHFFLNRTPKGLWLLPVIVYIAQEGSECLVEF